MIYCPECSQEFNLFVFEEDNVGVRVKNGMFICSCGIFSPIINFIPRFISDTQNSFSEFYIEFANRIKEIPFPSSIIKCLRNRNVFED